MFISLAVFSRGCFNVVIDHRNALEKRKKKDVQTNSYFLFDRTRSILYLFSSFLSTLLSTFHSPLFQTPFPTSSNLPSLRFINLLRHPLELKNMSSFLRSTITLALLFFASLTLSINPRCANPSTPVEILLCSQEAAFGGSLVVPQFIPSFDPTGVLHLVYGNVDVGGGP